MSDHEPRPGYLNMLSAELQQRATEAQKETVSLEEFQSEILYKISPSGRSLRSFDDAIPPEESINRIAQDGNSLMRFIKGITGDDERLSHLQTCSSFWRYLNNHCGLDIEDYSISADPFGDRRHNLKRKLPLLTTVIDHVINYEWQLYEPRRM